MQVPDMHPGEVWLVEAYRNPTDERWYTSNCQRSKLASQVDRELLVLRTWAAGLDSVLRLYRTGTWGHCPLHIPLPL